MRAKLSVSECFKRLQMGSCTVHVVFADISILQAFCVDLTLFRPVSRCFVVSFLCRLVTCSADFLSLTFDLPTQGVDGGLSTATAVPCWISRQISSDVTLTIQRLRKAMQDLVLIYFMYK